MKSKVVAILETRAGAHLAELIVRRGGVAMLAPALEEVPDVDPKAIQILIEQWHRNAFNICVFQTGVGTRALFAAVETLGLTRDLKELLGTALVAVRGPKPVGELNARGIRIDIRATAPFTTETLLNALADVKMEGASILVQRFGAANAALRLGLEARGAKVQEIATYRWALPQDTQPLLQLLEALQGGRVDAVVFTNAAQMHNLYAVAEQSGRAAQLAGQLNRSIIASVGPVCSRVLQEYGVTPTVEASPPKLGPLLAALDAALSA
ncbi:MAG TPA: uroporphyrinogen-III synthase [Steroidobacteraceae bacterium]